MLYLTEDPTMVIADKATIKAHYDALVKEAKTTMESLPAEKFPEGNWGQITNGCQLSLRFTQNTYKQGNSITAILLLRNLTNQMTYLMYPYHFLDLDGPATFQITSENGNVISDNLTPPARPQNSRIFHGQKYSISMRNTWRTDTP